MSKFKILVKQLYKQKTKSKSFIFMLILYIGILTAVTFWSDIKGIFVSDEQQDIAIINTTDVTMDNMFLPNDDLNWVFVEGDVTAELEDGTYLAAILLTAADTKLVADIQSYNPLALTEQQILQQEIQSAAQFYTMGKLDLTEEQSAQLLDSAPVVTMTTFNEEIADGKSTEEKNAGILISYGIGFLIYVFIATFLSMITTEVASEKGSRALEMLLVSVKPETHFRAKIVGMFLVAFTQFAVLFAVFLAFLPLSKDGENWSEVSEKLSYVPLTYFAYAVLFLFVTLFLYLILGALFGSLVSKVEEAGQVMMPAFFMTIIGFYVMVSGMSNPDTMLIKVFSYIPFTSGMVMPMRIGATDINPIEPIISLALLIVTALVLYKVSLSFYKRSVLTYSSGGVIQKIKTVFKVTT